MLHHCSQHMHCNYHIALNINFVSLNFANFVNFETFVKIIISVKILAHQLFHTHETVSLQIYLAKFLKSVTCENLDLRKLSTTR